ncbi:MAG: hypothetical protein JOZ77_13015 [Candidatus Eremiobacteraeota bacterium]|nr:hypothetical protein [Candidatus Eremiobacteraeota bacterium]
MMTGRSDCAKLETLAGAIALGEASDSERDAYRKHVARCPRCLSDFGGEREIERIMNSVALSRDQERWEPDLRANILRPRTPSVGWLWAGAVTATVLAIVAATTTPPSPPLATTPAISAREVRALAGLGTQGVVPREGRAESLSVGEATYSTAFDISVDQRGIPLHCTITRSSGLRALDQSACQAAMRGRYPRRPQQR